jgi:hypothetical protein
MVSSTNKTDSHGLTENIVESGLSTISLNNSSEILQDRSENRGI